MPLFRITVKTAKNSNGVRIEKGMSVDVIDAFYRIYGIDIKKAGALSTVYLDVKKIG